MLFYKKLLQYCLCLIVSTVFMLLVTYIYTLNKDHGVLFFSAFFIAIVSSVAGWGLWYIKNKNLFENFLVVFTYILFNILFIYFGPVTMDRSLSSFIYFYSVERGEIPVEIFNDEYFRPYVKRRFEDGEKIGYLNCQDRVCKPKLKTRITYYVLYPLGRITNTLTAYDEFKVMADKLIKK